MVQRISRIIPPVADYFAAPFKMKGNGVQGSSSTVVQISASFVVTAAGYRQFMDRNRLDEVVEGLLEGINVKSIQEFYGPAAQIKEIIQASPIPEPLYSYIVEGYQGLGNGTKLVWPVALPYELFHGASGHPEFSYLRAADQAGIIDVIKTWWASLFDASAIFFRELNGQKHRDARITLAASTDWR